MIKLEKIVFYLFIFCLPFQIRVIFYQWTDNFNEWISVFLYLTDVLILWLVFSWFWRLRKKSVFKKDIIDFALMSFLFISFISLIQASNVYLGLYQLVKLLEFILLFFYLKYNFRNLFNFKKMAQVFVLGGLTQSVVAIFQYAYQANLGLRWLGESPLAPDIVGVAKIIVDGEKIIRAYGVFPHPNLLAAFLLAALFFLYYLWLSDKLHYGLLAGVFGLLSFALFLAFSRTIMAIFVLASLLYFLLFFKKNKRKIIYLFLLLDVYCLLFIISAWSEIYSRFSAVLTDGAMNLRWFYNEIALGIIGEYPLLGIGLGNFVWDMGRTFYLLAPWLFQPVHNIYLLIASEVGLIGLGLFLFFIFSILRELRISSLLRKGDKDSIAIISMSFIIFTFLFIGLFDHFFWTLQQGQLMFWALLGILASFNTAFNRQYV